MANFLIVHVNGQIGVGVFQASGFEVLRCNGELWQGFEPESFWGWFIDKAGLDMSVGHGFVIASDQESLTIPAEIRIASSLDLTQEAMQQALERFGGSVENLHLMTYPEGFRMTERTPTPQNQQPPQTSVSQNTLPDLETCGPILTICRLKMEEYKNK
ncbi:hypothetical protein [Helicobacter salomonis]|uniref:hypothetical protein n=1 Tax=Helicobacter salomonis TaxID=56878 RepID=UPI000CF088A0|nr:hypothetical protein [Helicobacter salomonis]